MVVGKLAALVHAGLGVSQATLPLRHRPVVKTIFSQFTGHPFEVDLLVARRAEMPGPLLLGLVSTIDAIAPVAVKFGIPGVERLNTRVIDIDTSRTTYLLQMQMARVIEHIAAWTVIHQREKAFKGHAIMQIFAGIDLTTDIDVLFIGVVQRRPPAPSQLGKGLI